MKKYAAAIGICILCLMWNISALALNTPVTISGWPGSFWQCPDSDKTLTPGKTGVRITTDPQIVQEGRGALHIFVEKTADNLHADAVQSVSEMEVGKTYRLSGLFNVPSTSNRYRILLGNTTLVVLGNEVGTQTWGRLNHVFKYDGSSTSLTIQASGGGDIYADSMSLQEVIYEEDCVTIAGYGKELLANGDFESDLDFTPAGEVQSCTVINKDAQAELSWINPPDKDFKSVKIYDITDGAMRYIGETDGEHYVVSGLENNTVYKLLIQTIDDWGNVSEGTVAEVMPVPDALKLSEFVFSSNGVKTDTLKPGTLNVKLSAKNNGMPEDYSVELIAVLLKDGAVIDISGAYSIIPCTDFRDKYTEIETELFIPEGNGYSVEAYAWNSFTGMDALRDFASLE